MQLGMIGLGRMGANMVRRLEKSGHQCVDLRSHSRDGRCAREGRPNWRFVDRRFRQKTQEAARGLAHGPRRRSSTARSTNSPSKLDVGDIVIDGGNSYYIDDIRRAKELSAKGIHYVDCGTSGGVWGLERGYCQMIGGENDIVKHLDPIFKALAPGRGNIDRTPGRDKLGGTAEEGYLHCGAVRRRPLREDGAQRHRVRHHGRLRRRPQHSETRQRRQAALRKPTPKPRRSATPSTIMYDFNLADVSEVWRRGSVIASWLLDLTAISFTEAAQS